MAALEQLHEEPCGEEHPRTGLRLAGRLATLELVAIAGVFAGWIVVDVVLEQVARARGRVRRTLRGP